MSEEPSQGSFDALIERAAKRVALGRAFKRLSERLDGENAAFENGAQSRSHILPLQILIAMAILGIIGWFFAVRIGHYFDWPPNVYRDEAVYNLTTAGVTWDVYYGPTKMCGERDCLLDPKAPASAFQKRMVLPAREFPLVGWKPRNIIYYRTTITLPSPLLAAGDTLAFHSLFIWAKTFDFYVNGTLVSSGEKELLNIPIPRTLIPQNGELTLAFRIDPSDLPYQGLAHRGDLVIGAKNLLAPTAFFAEERSTAFFLWFLLPKLAFCVMFSLLYLGVARRSEIFAFCLYGFIGAAEVFFDSRYAEQMTPLMYGPLWAIICRNLAILAFARFIVDFFRRHGRRRLLVLNSISAVVVAILAGSYLFLPERSALTVMTALSAILKPAVTAYGAWSAFLVSYYLLGSRRSFVRMLSAFGIGVFMALCVPASIFESMRWVVDILGLSGNTPAMYLYLVWIFDLILFVVLAAMIAVEFGRNLTAKRRFRSQLHEIQERLNLAQSVQQMLMPRTPEGSDARASYRVFFNPVEEMSGDWFNVLREEKTCRIFVGDVVGKGPSAALAVSVVASVLAEGKREQISTRDLIARISTRLYDLFGGHITTTLVAISWSETDDAIEIYSCGAVGWFVFDSKGARYVALRGSPVGLNLEPRIGYERLQVEPNAMLFTFTDGCLEGSRAIKQLIGTLGREYAADSITPEALNKLVHSIGKEFVHRDDQTLLAVRIHALPERAGDGEFHLESSEG